jgi:hypothetical protein
LVGHSWRPLTKLRALREQLRSFQCSVFSKIPSAVSSVLWFDRPGDLSPLRSGIS